ncbi:unnamed protein product, partial [Closterium sp. NIES-54]
VLGLPPSTGPSPPLLSPLPVQSQSQLQPASPLPGPSPYYGPTRGLTERREPESRPASPESRPASPESCPESPVRAVRTGRRVPRQRHPPVPGTHSMTLRPSSAPQRVPLPSPPASSLLDGPDPESDSLRAASPTVTRFQATAVTDPLFESTAASALVAELVDFAAACRLVYATSLVAESESASVCPPSVGGECALGMVVLEDRQEEFECFAAAVPHLVSMLLAPEGDSDAPDIPTPRSYAEAIEGPYSSQWQIAMDTKMASWKSTGTYIDEVPPPGANIVSGMRIFRVKRPPGSPPVFKARYVARGFSHRQGVDFFLTFSPTPKMTTLRLRRPLGFTGSFPAGTQWSLRRPVYGLRQAPREWHDTLRTTLAALGFAPSTADPSLFLRTDATLPPFYVLVYVDDLVFATADTEALAHVKSELQKRHTCTDLGELTSYLGLRITRDRAQCTITLTQSHMVQQVLERFGFTYSSPQSTPLPTGHSLSAPPSDESVEPSGPYPELVGCLITNYEFKLCNGRGGLYIGEAVLKNNVFVLEFVPDQGTADSDAIVNFTTWSHPPDLDPDFSPGGFWYSHTIPEAEQTRALAVIQQTTATEIAAAASTSAAKERTAAASTSAAAATSTEEETTTTAPAPIASSSSAPTPFINTTPTAAQQLTPAPHNVHRSANITTGFYSNSDLYRRSTDDITNWFEGELQQDLSLTVSSTVTQYLGLNFLDGENTIYPSAAKYTDTDTLFDHTSGASLASPDTDDSATRSRWLTRDAAARLAVRNHLPLAERAHFGQHKSAKALYDAVAARYSSPATAALGRLILPYLFPELSAFATVEDLITHLRTSDTRYRAALKAKFLDKNPPPMYITLYFIVTRLPDSLRAVKDQFLALDPTDLTDDMLEKHLLAAETSIVTAMIALCQEHRLEHRTKHIAVRYFLARELQQRGQLRLAYVVIRANTADIFTRALQPGDHQRFCTVLGLVPVLPHLLTACLCLY